MKYQYNSEAAVIWQPEQGEEACFPLADLPEPEIRKLAVWGLHHKLRNAIAGAKNASDSEKIAIAERQWLRIRFGEKAELIPAWMPEVIARLRGFSEPEALSRLLELPADSLKALAAHPEVRKVKVELERERLEASENEAEPLDSLF